MGRKPMKKHSHNLAAVTIVSCLFMVGAMVALFVAWKSDTRILFYIVLTVVLAAAAGVNLFMVFRRIQNLRGGITKIEFWALYILVVLVLASLSGLVGISFTIQENIATYPVIFSSIPVLMLFINGYVSYAEAQVAARKAREGRDN
jgi:hypothetical protein